MTTLLEGVLTPELLALVAGRPLRAPLALLSAESNARQADKHLLFLVEEGSHTPFGLVKWAQGAAAPGLRREQAALNRVRASGDPLLVKSCAPSWGPFELANERCVTIERYLPCSTAYAQLRTSLLPHRLVGRHFHLVTKWLTRFVKGTRGPVQVIDAAFLEENVEMPLGVLAAHFGREAIPTGALERTLKLARAHIGYPIRLAAEHGDLWPANVLLSASPRELYIVDWEHFRPAALPGFDVLLFCTTYVLDFPGRPFGWSPQDAAFRRAYMETGWLGSHVRRTLDAFCAASGLPATLIPVLIPVMLARMSLRHADSVPAREEGEGNGWLAPLRAWWRRPKVSWVDRWAETHRSAIR